MILGEWVGDEDLVFLVYDHWVHCGELGDLGYLGLSGCICGVLGEDLY